MPWAIDATLSLTLLLTSLSAVVITAALLALEFFGNRRIARQAPGAIAVLLAFGALVVWLGGLNWVALGAGSLATVLFVAWPMSFDVVRQRMMRQLTPKVAWALVLGVSLIASRYLAAHVLHSLDREQSPPQSVDLEDLPIRFTEALTDRGRTVGLFHFKIHSTDTEIQQFIDSHEKDRSQIIRLQEPNSAANCHGWVFTGGAFGIRDPEIAAILNDNGYTEVTDPREGDLAIYTSEHRITHSGLVRMADKHAPVLIESKWGSLGVYLHTIDKQPFSGACKFYRSTRPDHLLVMRPANSAVQPVYQQLNDSTGAQ
jgi:hypothetical protein